jgi:hypothetical protein
MRSAPRLERSNSAPPRKQKPSRFCSSDFSRIVGPVKQGLSLSAPAIQVSSGTVLLELRDMTANCAPPLNLPEIVHATATHVIATKPLKPAPRMLVVDPAFGPPTGKRLRRIHFEIIQSRIVPAEAKLRAHEPLFWKFLPAVSQIFPAENSESQHLFRSQLGFELRMKGTAYGLCSQIGITFLH